MCPSCNHFGSDWNISTILIQTCIVARGWISLILMILSLFLLHHQEVDISPSSGHFFKIWTMLWFMTKCLQNYWHSQQPQLYFVFIVDQTRDSLVNTEVHSTYIYSPSSFHMWLYVRWLFCFFCCPQVVKKMNAALIFNYTDISFFFHMNITWVQLVLDLTSREIKWVWFESVCVSVSKSTSWAFQPRGVSVNKGV